MAINDLYINKILVDEHPITNTTITIQQKEAFIDRYKNVSIANIDAKKVSEAFVEYVETIRKGNANEN